MTDWHLFYGQGDQIKKTEELIEKLKESPPWREFSQKDNLPDKDNDDKRWQNLRELAKEKTRQIKKGKNFRFGALDPNNSEYSAYSQEAIEKNREVIDAVNAAIYLRRPLLVTGNPGSGKSSLAYAIAYELNLGPVLSWAINARSNLQEGLYRYDAIARLQDANQNEEQPLGSYIKLGALGTAFLPSRLPRVLLIDEIDKSDINLPNDLLNIFEEGEFEIPELVRRSKKDTETFTVQTQDKNLDVEIKGGRISCYAFPIVVMTSNGEREFPPAFKRRCLRVRMPDPEKAALERIVIAHFGEEKFNQKKDTIDKLIKHFDSKTGEANKKATDQLLNTIYVLTREDSPQDEEKRKKIRELLMKPLSDSNF